MIHLFLTGWLIGFLIALPLGPIGVLCVQYSLRRGMIYGLAAGLGASLADAIFAIIAGLGVTIISNTMTNYGPWLQLIGAAIFGYLGINILIQHPHHTIVKTQSQSLLQIFLSTFLATITSPSTFLIFVGIFTGLLGPTGSIGLLETLVLTIGVFIGSATWAILLSSTASHLGKKLNPDLSSPWFNIISGTIIIFFACGIALSALREFL